MPTPENYYRLTDSIIGTLTSLQSVDLVYAVDKSDTSQHAEGSSKKLPISVISNYVLAQIPNYVPYDGTTYSNPLTGPLILSDGFYIGNEETGGIHPSSRVIFDGSVGSFVSNEPGIGVVGIELNPLASTDPYAKIYSDIPTFGGLEYEGDYSGNFRPNTLVTKQFVEDQIAAIDIPSPVVEGAIVIQMWPISSTTLSPAVIGDAVIPYDCQITEWYIFGTDATGTPITGSAQVDLYLDTYTNYPPTSADTLFPTGKPSLSSQSKNGAVGLAIPLLQDSVLRVELTSVSTFSRLYLTLKTQSL